MPEKETKFSEAEQIVLDNEQKLFDIIVQLIPQIRHTIANAWEIRKLHDPEYAKINPFDKLIDMLKFYATSAENDYANYCQENQIEPIDKTILKNSKKEQNKEAVITKAKQINKIL